MPPPPMPAAIDPTTVSSARLAGPQFTSPSASFAQLSLLSPIVHIPPSIREQPEPVDHPMSAAPHQDTSSPTIAWTPLKRAPEEESNSEPAPAPVSSSPKEALSIISSQSPPPIERSSPESPTSPPESPWDLEPPIREPSPLVVTEAPTAPPESADDTVAQSTPKPPPESADEPAEPQSNPKVEEDSNLNEALKAGDSVSPEPECSPQPAEGGSVAPEPRSPSPPPVPKVKLSLKDFAIRKKKEKEEKMKEKEERERLYEEEKQKNERLYEEERRKNELLYEEEKRKNEAAQAALEAKLLKELEESRERARLQKLQEDEAQRKLEQERRRQIPIRKVQPPSVSNGKVEVDERPFEPYPVPRFLPSKGPTGFQNNGRAASQEDGEITPSPPRILSKPPVRTYTPPTQPRSFQASSNGPPSAPPARRFNNNFSPNSRPLPSGPRALRNLPAGQQARHPGGRAFPYNNPFPPREPSADRDPDRDRNWLIGSRANPTGWNGR
ncbi:hypothetical protein C8J56DRAFT_17928 [Mycena floridula]|nr:hypothetical protein C8J56DRAFT_17928 [Mycena floridula]